MIGKIISHYHILEKIGEGGTGVVYKARDTRLDRTVALKFLHPYTMHDEDRKKRIIREGRAIASLNHPNIATIYDIAEVDGQLFIVMEFYEGKTLQKRIEEEKFEISEAIQIALQIAAGLNKSHSKNIIHRDIKPGNIIFSGDGELKIIDFGLAKLKDTSLLTQTGTILGTVAYMSPEQLKGTTVDKRTDIWSLGVILYEMLTGVHPFKGEYDQAILYSILNVEPKPVTITQAGISSEIEQIVNKALAKDQGERYQKLDDIIHDLEAVSKQLGIETKTIFPFKSKYSVKKKAYLYGGIVCFFAFTTFIFLHIFTSFGKAIDSIAVLPLLNLSGDPEHEYFANGMTEALTAELGQISALKVISRTSAMRYKDSNKSIPEIARELNVDGLVEGSVLPSGEEVRVTIQLIDGSTDRHIWSASYQRGLRDILALQNEIARSVAEEIHVSLSPEEQRRLETTPTVDPEAYRLHLIGNHHLSEYSLQEALDSYQEAVIIDPEYAPAYAGIAMATIEMGTWWGSLPPHEVLPMAKMAVDRALELDTYTAEAYIAIGSIEYLFEWDWQDAEAAFKRGMELNPGSSYFRIMYANFLTAMGRFEESIEIGVKTVELDPLSPTAYNELAFAHQLAGRHEEALKIYLQGLRIDPDFMQTHGLLAGFYLERGEPQKALEHLAHSDSVSKTPPISGMALHGCYYAIAGEREKARSILSDLTELSKKQYVPAISFFDLHYGLGENQKALSWLEKAFKERNVGMVWLNVDPLYDDMRNDPRFQNVLKQMNFPG